MSSNCDITAIRRPGGTYSNSVEPLGLADVARQLTASASSSNTQLTATCRRISMRANGGSIRFSIGSTAQTANANSHFISNGERLDFAVPKNPNIAVVRDGASDATLEITELV